MAATTRTVTGIIYKPDGTLWTSQTITFDLLTTIAVATDGNVVPTSVTATTDASTAAFSVDLAVPASGAYDWKVSFPNGQVEYFTLADGDATTLHAIMASQETTETADGILTLIDGKLDAADYTAADVLSKLLTVDGSGTGLDADKLDGSHASAFEASLGNPDADGYVLSSTALGERSWIQSAADVDDLTTTTGSSTNMLRVAAAGGLEYRTTAQVLADIGAAPTASPTFTGTVTLPTTVASVIKPASDSTTALQLTNAAGTAVVTVDTTNRRIGVGRTPTGAMIEAGNLASYGYKIIECFNPAGNSCFYVDGNGPWSSTVRGNAVNVRDYSGSATVGIKSSSFSLPGLEVTNASGVKLISALMNSSSQAFVSIGNITATAALDIAASTTSAASLRIRSGTAPTSPNDGDIWYDGSNLKICIGATTYNVDVTAV